MKKRYKGVFNYNNEITVLYRYANNKVEAKRLFIIEISKKYRRTQRTFNLYFSGEKDNFTIEEG